MRIPMQPFAGFFLVIKCALVALMKRSFSTLLVRL